MVSLDRASESARHPRSVLSIVAAYRTIDIAIAPPPPTLTRLGAGGSYRTIDIAIAPPPPTLIPTIPR
ncbi:hypothetical protein [Haloarcula vallismortis]|uniref:hypothetical protein n=1 Tax=Haloarcula vallismortis TaxID=28442 RepID=UPI0011142260|nr:hypothetical protein [Haloarcula vallismortis]